jgi:uncharacterized protein YkwD
MTELVPGANMSLPGGLARLSLTGPFDLSALVTGADGKVGRDEDFVFYNQPSAPGVRLSAEGVTVEGAGLRPGAERVVVVASPEDQRTPFGRLPAPTTTVRGRDGRVIAVLRPPRLGSETVLTLAEIYRRDGRWKLRALGQGYADGLAGLARDYGVDVEDTPARAPAPAPVPTPAQQPVPVPVPVPAGAARPSGPSGPAGAAGSNATLLAEVVAATNAERTRRGLVALNVEARLAGAAQAHSDDMARRNFFAHESPEGRSVADRVRAFGYRYRVVAENIAAGQRTADEVVTGWMNSPGHRANILNAEVRQIGVGLAAGGTYGTCWTQVFGTLLL